MDLDRLQGAIKLILDALIGRRLDYLALYPCKVVGQAGNTVEIVPDDSRIPGTTGVPIYSGTPGTTAVIPDGTRVLLGFEGGNPMAPYASLWGTLSPKPTSVTLEADTSVDIKAGDVTLESTGNTEIKAGATGAYPNEHATSAEAVVSLIAQVLLQVGAQNPGPVVGTALAALVPAILNAAIPLTATVPMLPYSAAILATLAAKPPDPTGIAGLPGPGWPNARGA